MPNKRQVFYSFHYKPDAWRAAQVRNIGTIEGNRPAHDNDWETISRGGDAAIERWIDEQMQNRTCAVVLIGSETAGRKWIEYEIKRAWGKGMGLVGVHIHNLRNHQQLQSTQGGNPFAGFTLNGAPFDQIVKTYNPPFMSSTDVYSHIARNLENWTHEAVQIRQKHPY